MHESVVRGEIDNRVKGVVKGTIWLEGRPDPLVLDLAGNAWPDLAGCLLQFVNPLKPLPHPHVKLLNPMQRGTIGDITASRKVRVFDVPLDQALAMYDRKEKPPEHMANCLYLEWFSDANGRVVIESPDYQLTISAPEWRMTPEEDIERAEQCATGMTRFMARLTEAVERERRGQKDPNEDWNEHDYEKLFRESDARTDKYLELLDKYGDSPEAQEKIAQAMGWTRDDEDDSEEDDDRLSVEEMNRITAEALNEPEPQPDPLREGIDWIRTDNGDIRHPLQHRSFQSAVRFWQQVKDLGLIESADEDLQQFLFEFQCCGAKLAGALNSHARGQGPSDAAFTVAALKRALDRLHRAQSGLEAVARRQALPATLIAEARQEMFELREAILRHMDHYRGRP